MENYLLAVTMTSLLVGAPLIWAQHMYMRAHSPDMDLIVRYALGAGTIAVCLSLAGGIAGSLALALAPWMVCAVLGAAVLLAYRADEIARRGKADQAELEARRGQADRGR